MTTNTTTNESASAQQQTSKKSYKKPTLAALGSVKQLTQTGSGTMADATMTAMA